MFASVTRREPILGGSTPASMLATVHRSEYRFHVLRFSGAIGAIKGKTTFRGRDCTRCGVEGQFTQISST